MCDPISYGNCKVRRIRVNRIINTRATINADPFLSRGMELDYKPTMEGTHRVYSTVVGGGFHEACHERVTAARPNRRALMIAIGFDGAAVTSVSYTIGANVDNVFTTHM